MKLKHVEIIIGAEPFASSSQWAQSRAQIEEAIAKVVWPPGADKFVLHPDIGRGRGEANGVAPIKTAFLTRLSALGWMTDERHNPLRFDAFRPMPSGPGIGLEWETGNISSSHRSINRILRGHLEGVLVAGVLVLPTRKLYRYLTDRVGNYEELQPYFPLWRRYPWADGVLAVFAVEHDGTDPGVPRIAKGTNGRAQG